MHTNLHPGESQERYSQGHARSVVSCTQLLLTRDFGLVWWGQMVPQIGDGVSKPALLWFVYSITGSPLKTTVIGLPHKRGLRSSWARWSGYALTACLKSRS